jgi:hypothetical protein
VGTVSSVTARVQWPGWAGVGAFLIRRVPFTSAVVLAMVVLSVASRALWVPIESLPVFRYVGFGLPAFDDGRWYTLAFGAFFALIPVYYLFVAGGFALLVGFSEFRLGTPRTILVTVGGHLVGVMGAAAVLAIGRGTTWPWAARIGAMTDVGFSAGMLAAVCVASVTLSTPWGLRIRLAAATYAGLSLLYIGLMADLEHSIAVVAGWSLARVVAGTRAVPQEHPTPGEWRVLGAAGLTVVTLMPAVVRMFPGQGPTGTAEHSSVFPVLWHLLLLAAGIVAAAGWYRGRRWALPLGLGVAATSVLVGLTVAVVGVASSLPGWLRGDAPTVYADAVAGLALGALLLFGRRAVIDDPDPKERPVPMAGSGVSASHRRKDRYGAGSQR